MGGGCEVRVECVLPKFWGLFEGDDLVSVGDIGMLDCMVPSMKMVTLNFLSEICSPLFSDIQLQL